MFEEGRNSLEYFIAFKKNNSSFSYQGYKKDVKKHRLSPDGIQILSTSSPSPSIPPPPPPPPSYVQLIRNHEYVNYVFVKYINCVFSLLGRKNGLRKQLMDMSIKEVRLFRFGIVLYFDELDYLVIG